MSCSARPLVVFREVIPEKRINPYEQRVNSRNRQLRRTLERGLELFVHHALNDLFNVCRMWVAGTVVHRTFIHNIISGVAGLGHLHYSTYQLFTAQSIGFLTCSTFKARRISPLHILRSACFPSGVSWTFSFSITTCILRSTSTTGKGPNLQGNGLKSIGGEGINK